MPHPEEYPEELWGIEDPRITYVPELKQYAVAYTSYSKGGPGVSLALTSDFRNFERFGVIMSPDDKDAALLPHKIGGLWALIHRPMTPLGCHIWISYSPDLRHWGGHRVMMEARKGAWWDANKIGLSSPPIQTPRGWLVLYHGVKQTASGSLYRIGLALFDIDKPDNCLVARRFLDLRAGSRLRAWRRCARRGLPVRPHDKSRRRYAQYLLWCGRFVYSAGSGKPATLY